MSIPTNGDDTLRFPGKTVESIKLLGGNDRVFAGRGNDRISGNSGDDILNGGGGDDILRGGNGDDVLDGGQGEDTLNGGNGDDILTGGNGADVLIGGAGSDTFVFGNQAIAESLAGIYDQIVDFVQGADRLSVAGKTFVDGTSTVTFGAGNRADFDFDGDGNVDFSAKFNRSNITFTSADFAA